MLLMSTFSLQEIIGFTIQVYTILLVFSFPTIYIWRWIFAKFIKKEKTKKIASWTATFLATPIIYLSPHSNSFANFELLSVR